MRIFVDITHPADVHFFRHPIRHWLEQQHEVQVVARDKDLAHELLALFRIPFRPLGRAGRGLLGLTLELAHRESAIFRLLRDGRCDVACGFGATFLVHAARILGIPTVVFTDAENARIANRLTFPFATLISTPRSYRDDLGARQRRFNGYKELAYLHPSCFTPDPAVLREAGLREGEPFVFVRLTAWNSSHDFRQHGLVDRREAFERLARFGRVVVSVERAAGRDADGLRFTGPLHRFNGPFDKVHHLLAYARLFFGESATMACESAMLGTPAILVSTSRRGFTDELEERYGMVFTYDHPRRGQEQALRKAEALLSDPRTPHLWQQKRASMLSGQENVARYVTDLVAGTAARRGASLAARVLIMLLLALPARAAEPAASAVVPRFPMPKSGLELERPVRPAAFFDVVGRRSALFGYENRGLEAWAYPLKLVDDFRLSFRLEGYPLDIEGADVVAWIQVRPEATVLTYSHPAFTVRQVMFAPLDEPATVMLLDVDSTLPMTITGSFRPRLKLMWPAGLMTGNVGWDEKAHLYAITEETKRFVALVGSPGARDTSVMPYQEEPKDVPLRFVIDVPRERMASHLVPILFVGGVEGKEKAQADYERLLAAVPALYGKNVAYYHALQERTTRIATPDDRLDTAFAWAKVGIDKGLATNPTLGSGLLAGFRTSGESERPGFAWLFGRDALWTALALHAEGDFAATRIALDFLRKFQRADGKIPHEISQSAALIPWFTDYPYPWNSADATPLYVVAHADRFRATGDLAYVRESWESIVKAWRFTAATDTDGNGLVENTKFGHGWVEGGALYPPHEEIYMQGVWIEACRGLAEMAQAAGDATLTEEARAWAERTRAATEATYWMAGRGFYAFATKRPDEKRREAEPGPDRERRQARMDELKDARLVDEDTVLPAVPLWWTTLADDRAQSQIDHLGAAELSADWGDRLLSERSRLYDPLSYHYGSVWPLFTGWAAMGAYRYGRPHVGYQATMANALLTFDNALGYVTELLSGAFDAPFGRSSHHQIWSEAMVVSPVLRGLLGLETSDAGRVLTFAPQLPADWDRVAVRNVAAGDARVDLALERGRGEVTVTVTRRAGTAGALRIRVAPWFPLDASVRSATVDGRSVPMKAFRRGDGQSAEVELDATATHRVVFRLEEGTGVYAPVEAARRGERSQGLRIVRARAEGGRLRLVLDGRAGRTYAVGVRGPRRPEAVPGVTVAAAPNGDARLLVSFEGPDGGYVRRELDLPLR